MSKDEILAELPKLKEDLVYALQRMHPLTKLIEAELGPFVPEIRSKFESVGRELAGVRAAHTGDHRTPIVLVQPAGKDAFGGTAEEQAVIEWLKKEVLERAGVAAGVEPGWGAAKSA